MLLGTQSITNTYCMNAFCQYHKFVMNVAICCNIGCGRPVQLAQSLRRAWDPAPSMHIVVARDTHDPFTYMETFFRHLTKNRVFSMP